MLSRLEPVLVERVWGRQEPGLFFERQERPVGEVWFQTEPPLSLLTKFIFTSQPLSVQVHPDDEQARALGLANGKTEMWHVLDAAPGSQLALGFRRSYGLDEVRTACLDGTVEQMLHYEQAAPGATYFTPAGTVHAIGAGLSLVEIQQNSDTTFRLYDYGRPRELHLDQGLEVARLEPWRPAAPTRGSEPPWRTLAACEFFHVEGASFAAESVHAKVEEPYALLIVLEGAGALGGHSCRAGEVWLAPAGTGPFSIQPQAGLRLLRARP